MACYGSEDEVTGILKNDLGKILSTDDLNIKLSGNDYHPKYSKINKKEIIDIFDVEIKKYDLDPSLLETEQTGKNKIAHFSNLLKTNCPVTGQPDWASVYIEYKSSLTLKKESLLKYIVSFRNHQDFHENCCEKIFCDIHEKCKPDYLIVKCFFTRRGGIEINPVRYCGTVPNLKFDDHYWRQ
jgi:7-cyano-7-deazaguanine reductase